MSGGTRHFDQESADTDLVMIGDLTTLPEYAEAMNLSSDRLYKLVRNRRKGSNTTFPRPVKSFKYFDAYLISELDAYFISTGDLVALG